MTKLLILLFGTLKFSKLLTTGGTMLLSIGVYAMFWGWPFALGFVILLLIHELGHYIAARQKGLAVGAPTFIPFVGAWIEMKSIPHDAETEAYVGLGGPLAGAVASVCCYLVARHYNSPLLLAISYSGLFLNLFNLIPLSPLDGGRICAAISPKIWLAGIPVLIGAFLYKPSPMLILIGVAAIPMLAQVFKGKYAQPAHYYDLPIETRLKYAFYYLALTTYLAVMTYDVHEMIGR